MKKNGLISGKYLRKKLEVKWNFWEQKSRKQLQYYISKIYSLAKSFPEAILPKQNSLTKQSSLLTSMNQYALDKQSLEA